jgi:hypothetical protein
MAASQVPNGSWRLVYAQGIGSPDSQLLPIPGSGGYLNCTFTQIFPGRVEFPATPIDTGPGLLGYWQFSWVNDQGSVLVGIADDLTNLSGWALFERSGECASPWLDYRALPVNAIDSTKIATLANVYEGGFWLQNHPLEFTGLTLFSGTWTINYDSCSPTDGSGMTAAFSIDLNATTGSIVDGPSSSQVECNPGE